MQLYSFFYIISDTCSDIICEDNYEEIHFWYSTIFQLCRRFNESKRHVVDYNSYLSKLELFSRPPDHQRLAIVQGLTP